VFFVYCSYCVCTSSTRKAKDVGGTKIAMQFMTILLHDLNTLRMGHDESHDLNPMHHVWVMTKVVLNSASFIEV
jgi:hypothetical protein